MQEIRTCGEDSEHRDQNIICIKNQAQDFQNKQRLSIRKHLEELNINHCKMKKTLEEINNPEGERMKRLLKHAWIAFVITIAAFIAGVVTICLNYQP